MLSRVCQQHLLCQVDTAWEEERWTQGTEGRRQKIVTVPDLVKNLNIIEINVCMI